MQKTLTLRIYQSVGSLKKKSKNTAATQMVRHPELVSGSIVQSEMLKQVQHDVVGRQQRTKTVTLSSFQGLFIVRSEMLKQVQHDQDVNHTQID